MPGKNSGYSDGEDKRQSGENSGSSRMNDRHDTDNGKKGGKDKNGNDKSSEGDISSDKDNLKNSKDSDPVENMGGDKDSRLNKEMADEKGEKKPGEKPKNFFEEAKNISPLGSKGQGSGQNENIAEKGKEAAKMAAKGAMAGKAALTAQLILLFQKLLAFLKMTMQTIVQTMAQMVAGFLAMVMNFFSAVGAFFTGALKGLAALFGFTVKTAAAVVVATTAVVTGGTAAVIIENQAVETAQRDVPYDCATDVDKWMAANATGDVDVSEEQKVVAGKIYAVFNKLGYDDKNIAGMLGNLHHESGMDPTTIETMGSTERFTVGPIKQKLVEVSEMDRFTQNDVWSNYNTSKLCIPCYGRDGVGAPYAAGIGLIQFTGPGHDAFFKFVEANKFQWGEVETQLLYLMAPAEKGGYAGGGGGSKWLREWNKTKETSIESATEAFAVGIEGNWGYEYTNEAARINAAHKWEKEMKLRKADDAYVDSVIGLLSSLTDIAGGNAVANQYEKCATANRGFSNESIAHAASSFAWPTKEQSVGTSGTPLYTKLMDAIWPGDIAQVPGPGRSCDRCASVAIKWAGADDSIPAGDVAEQYSHMSSSDKWQKISTGSSLDKLLPGDILVRNGKHIMVFTGPEIMKQVQGSLYHEGNNLVHASHTDRSPGSDQYTDNEYFTSFDIFRNIKQETNPKYLNAGGTTAVQTPGKNGTPATPAAPAVPGTPAP